MSWIISKVFSNVTSSIPRQRQHAQHNYTLENTTINLIISFGIFRVCQTYKKFNLLEEIMKQWKGALVQLVLTWLVKGGLVNDLFKFQWDSWRCLIDTTLHQTQTIIFKSDSSIHRSVYLSYLPPLQISLPNVSDPHKNQAWPQVIHVQLQQASSSMPSYDLYQTLPNLWWRVKILFAALRTRN